MGSCRNQNITQAGARMHLQLIHMNRLSDTEATVFKFCRFILSVSEGSVRCFMGFKFEFCFVFFQLIFDQLTD